MLKGKIWTSALYLRLNKNLPIKGDFFLITSISILFLNHFNVLPFQGQNVKEKSAKTYPHISDTQKYVLFGNIGMCIFTSKFTGFIVL